MPRRPRIHLDGVPLHIVQRGHNREPCFFAEEDFGSYLHWLGEALGVAECALHAYVLMTNHVHLLLTPKKATTVPGLIISLGRRYVQYINRTYNRTGTLCDSRYKSSLVQEEEKGAKEKGAKRVKRGQARFVSEPMLKCCHAPPPPHPS